MAGVGFGMCFGSRAFSFRRVDVPGAGAGWDRGRDRARWRGRADLDAGAGGSLAGFWRLVRGSGWWAPWAVWLVECVVGFS